MTWGRMKVRNACPFPVTFYALAGPTLELGPGETKTAHACLIWFSTRVKGPSTPISNDGLKRYSQNYYNTLLAEGINPASIPGVQDGGEGAALGSFLRWFVPEVWNGLTSIFKVKNTQPGNDLYIGAKKEAVYGNADLVVYASLDPGCRPRPEIGKCWYLHLDNDHGQVTPPEDSEPMYIKPDLKEYKDTIFMRAFNDSGYLSVNRETGVVENIPQSEPFNPFEYPSYWTISPEMGEERKVKILNTYSQKWLVDFSSSDNLVGMLSTNYTDYADQHWILSEKNNSPETVTIANFYTGLNLYSNHTGVGVYAADYPDQHFRIQTLHVDLSSVPSGVKFRIMHVKSGMYITFDGVGNPYRLSEKQFDTQFFTKKVTKGGSDTALYQPDIGLFLGVMSDYYSGGVFPVPGDDGILWISDIDVDDAGFSLRNVYLSEAPYFPAPFMTGDSKKGSIYCDFTVTDSSLWVAQLE
ncbi:hypothetical protein [Klebsiella aerogenes]|uniref:hypothetical protein n=1 Tax=Klebsiella aerogenes TaxID=548 RepID=UPI002FF5E049